MIIFLVVSLLEQQTAFYKSETIYMEKVEIFFLGGGLKEPTSIESTVKLLQAL